MSPARVAVVCASCGATNVGVQGQCLLCGSALPQPTATAAAAPQNPAAASRAAGFCPSCGAPRTGTKFCTKCGTRF